MQIKTFSFKHGSFFKFSIYETYIKIPFESHSNIFKLIRKEYQMVKSVTGAPVIVSMRNKIRYAEAIKTRPIIA